MRRDGWTIVRLAVAAGCAPSTMYAALGGYLPRGLTNRIAQALNVPVEEIVDGGKGVPR